MSTLSSQFLLNNKLSKKDFIICWKIQFVLNYHILQMYTTNFLYESLKIPQVRNWGIDT